MDIRLCVILAVATCFYVDGILGLTCNKCSVGIFGHCLIPDSMDCDDSSPNCYTGKAEFPSISGFLGFNTQGCLDSASCNSTTNGTILGAAYTVTRSCCSTDSCNPVVSGSGSVRLSLTAAACAALVATVWSSWMY
ncbi:hypothetical protein JZ751_005310 [Albula glossodonta]|uniref:UPAR/Ly6 domain-containing protein n=1 Tax=Albula glossodonta TaxID=121402 RepID=A0A8T2NC85_9TELE|nr:hypothetical protein JZ751_017283 [Albula glossodonta]KAG9335388.1 hypothetical protein JZ751_005310 [Albula glossodonta]